MSGLHARTFMVSLLSLLIRITCEYAGMPAAIHLNPHHAGSPKLPLEDKEVVVSHTEAGSQQTPLDSEKPADSPVSLGLDPDPHGIVPPRLNHNGKNGKPVFPAGNVSDIIAETRQVELEVEHAKKS